ncbi:helix-turn-helix domain-containing protein [Kribbella sancticallisti]|uniref:TetR/AcrR family transcriptional regulator n=1 Tax=Kribbella sancticallisti TaxID=460087 RepID=UPI0031E3EF86
MIAAAARAFSRGGFAATSLEDVASEAGVSRVLIYRHFESKTELYEAVLMDVGDQLRRATGGPDQLTPGSLGGLVAVARDNPDGFRLFFRHSSQEPEFRRHADELQAAMAATAEPYLREALPDEAGLRWAAQLVPIVAIEAVIAWLDAGQPQPQTAVATIGQIIGGVVSAIGGTGQPAARRGETDA